METTYPRILIGAFRGGAGKTLLSLGLLSAWRSSGARLAVFKKGPDYIDAAWLARASGTPCYNLDTYLMGEEAVVRSFALRTQGVDAAVVEGNRGLFDGMGVEGRHSSAALASHLGLSVFLVIDCTKSTRTVAALLKGCQVLDPDVSIQGVVLNQVATSRHESVIRSSIERYCGVPVLGAIPRQRALALQERHLGLLPPEEHGAVEDALEHVRQIVTAHVDVAALWGVAERHAAATAVPEPPHGARVGDWARTASSCGGLRIGIVRDSAFRFYYPENIEALVERGAEIVDVEAARDPRLPDLDGLYIGGGFPETHARALAENASFRRSVQEAVEGGLPVYAECGGAVYLGKGLEWEGRFYPMAHVFPVVYRLHEKPQGHGYTLLDVEGDNPLFPAGTRLRGHEFHYAGVAEWDEAVMRFACSVRRGFGFDGRREGLCYRNAYATFTHLHAWGESRWADHFLERAADRSAAFHEARTS